MAMDEDMKIWAKCSVCGKEDSYQLTKDEAFGFVLYKERINPNFIQDILPNCPNWIRAANCNGSTGFCICPDHAPI